MQSSDVCNKRTQNGRNSSANWFFNTVIESSRQGEGLRVFSEEACNSSA